MKEFNTILDKIEKLKKGEMYKKVAKEELPAKEIRKLAELLTKDLEHNMKKIHEMEVSEKKAEKQRRWENQTPSGYLKCTQKLDIKFNFDIQEEFFEKLTLK